MIVEIVIKNVVCFSIEVDFRYIKDGRTLCVQVKLSQFFSSDLFSDHHVIIPLNQIPRPLIGLGNAFFSKLC